MNSTASIIHHPDRDVASPRIRSGPHIAIVPLGMGLGTFLSVTFVLCVLFDLWFPALAMNSAWAPLLPGFTWISWPSFLLGLVESFAYGWYVAIFFAPLYNFFSARHEQGSPKGSGT